MLSFLKGGKALDGEMCRKQYFPAFNTVSGANSYTFSNSVTTNTVSLSPPVTTTFNVSGSNQNCQASKVFTVNVKACTGLEEENQHHFIQVYPNPGDGLFSLHVSENGSYQVYDYKYQLVERSIVKEGQQFIDLRAQPPGLYFLRVCTGSRDYLIKLIVE